MSRTSLGQKQLRQREDMSSLKQLQSIRRINQQQAQQTHINIIDEVDYFLHMKDRYLKVEKENRFMDLDRDNYGECYSNIKDGYGINIFKNGDRYIGFWEQNTMNNMGIYIFKSLDNINRIVYLGEFHYGKFNGIGKLVKMTDDVNGEVIYKGNWSEGQKSDQGIHFYDNQQINYQGSWLRDQKSGEGKLTFPGGEYVGFWQNNVRHGLGKLKKTENGFTTIYDGNWQNDELLQGEITYLDMNGIESGKYRGQILDGKKHGYGVYNWRNMTYEGNFELDKIKGEGTVKANSYSLSGYLSEYNEDNTNLQNLTAVINYENKDSFDGGVSIVSGMVLREKGLYRFSNGDVAEGQFVDNPQGKLEGSFLYRWRNGQQRHY